MSRLDCGLIDPSARRLKAWINPWYSLRCPEGVKGGGRALNKDQSSFQCQFADIWRSPNHGGRTRRYHRALVTGHAPLRSLFDPGQTANRNRVVSAHPGVARLPSIKETLHLAGEELDGLKRLC
jgi:hypothetical protein